MVCRNCNTVNEDNAKFCAKCGAALFSNNQPQAPNAPATGSQPEQGFAIAAMICGIMGIVSCMIVPGILGIVFGNKAKNAGNTSGMAKAGVICGGIGLGVGILFWTLYIIGIVAAFA